jgi:predicted nucleic acid-binding protein
VIKRVFLDSDVVLDVATGREPFVHASKASLAVVENGYAIGVVSANSVTNIYYVLRKLSSGEKAKEFLRTLLEYVSAVPVDHEVLKQALQSEFLDFEDGVQHYCAAKHQCELIITRNTKHYKKSQVTVLEPREFIALYA